MLKKAQYNSVALSSDTEHFFEAKGHSGKSRAQVPEWVKDGPNAVTFRMMMDAVSAEKSDASADLSRTTKMRSPKIAVPSMLLGNKGKTDSVRELKKELKKLDINFKMDPEYWKRFNHAANDNLTYEFGEAASYHRKNIRDLLSENDFLYIPRDCAPKTSREKLEFLLLVLSAAVQRQVFTKDAPFIIMERGQFATEFMEIFKALKNMGLIGQRIEHLMKITDGPEQSAQEIKAIMHLIPPAKRQAMYLPETKAIPMPDNHTSVMYCSASNNNADWTAQIEDIAEMIALQQQDFKLGGGKEGQMEAGADGYMRGLNKLHAAGIESKGRLHLIQCDATKTLEGNYEIPEHYKHLERYVEKRCYKTIEERRYDLQKSHLTIGAAGGLGTLEEFVCELLAALYGEKDRKTYKFHLFSQSGVKPDGTVGRVYDFMDDLLRPILPHGMVDVIRTKEEMIRLVIDEKAKYDELHPEHAAEKIPLFPLPTAQIIDVPARKIA